MIFGLLIQLLCVGMIAAAKPTNKPERRKSTNKLDSGLSKNVTALWKKVNAMPDPINIHVANDQQTHAAHFGTNNQHIHIHLSLEECVKDNISMDEYIYARCDMVKADDKDGTRINGSIYMRQKPKQVMESKIRLGGFTKASKGMKKGVHDFFFDLHSFADFNGQDRCSNFGDHDHFHHEEGIDASSRTHDHGKSHGAHVHAHDHHHSHDHKGHLVHNHDHALMDGWGDVVVTKIKKNVFTSHMEQNSTIHQLYGPESVMGRGIVLHDKVDKNVCCCSITYASIDDKAWESL